MQKSYPDRLWNQIRLIGAPLRGVVLTGVFSKIPCRHVAGLPRYSRRPPTSISDPLKSHQAKTNCLRVLINVLTTTESSVDFPTFILSG